MDCRGCGAPFLVGEASCAKCGWKGSPGGSTASGPSEKIDRSTSSSPDGTAGEIERTVMSGTAVSPGARLAGALALVGLFVVATFIFLRSTPSDDAASPIFGGELGKDELVWPPTEGTGPVPEGGELLDVLSNGSTLIKLSPSPDGRHLFYCVSVGEGDQRRNYVVNDRMRSENFEGVLLGTPTGADSQSGVWTIYTHQRMFLLQDGMKRGDRFHSIEEVCLDPESRRVAFVAFLGTSRF